jgi:hypothetical protein
LDAELCIQVDDVRFEAQLTVAALFHKAALGKTHGLVPFAYESWVCNLPKGPEACPLNSESLQTYNAARRTFADMIETSGAATLAEMLELAKRKRTVSLEIDPTFILELAFLQTKVLELVDKHVSNQNYACLPISNLGKSFPQATGALESLLEAEVVKAASVPIQHKVESVIELISNLERGVAPKAGFGVGDTFFETVVARFDYFLEHTVEEKGSAGVATKQKVLRGLAALRALFQETEVRATTKPEAITLMDLEPMQRMKGKLNKDECAKLSQ